MPPATPSASAAPALAAPPRAISGRLLAIFAAILLIAAYALGITASLDHSVTFDEPSHLVGGYIHWRLGDYFIHTENGYLPQAVAALPLLISRPHLPDTTSEDFITGNHFRLGHEFLYYDGNNFRSLALQGRAAIGLLTMLTGLLVFLWARRLFGPAPALLSLFVFLFSPIVLAHGFLITSDMAVTCFFLLALAAAWALMHRVTLARIVLTGLALGGLALSKMSSPIIVPVLLLLVIARAFHRAPLPISLPGMHRDVRRAWSKTAALLLAAVPVSALAIACIWAAFGFTYANLPTVITAAFSWKWALHDPNIILQIIAFARDLDLFPEAYLYGYAQVVQTTRIPICFANGVETRTGWWWFYPFVFLITTPIAVLLLIPVSLLATIRGWARPLLPAATANLYRAAPLLLFILVYAVAAIVSYRGTGPRHLLPLYPMLCILLAPAALLPFRSAFAKLLPVALCAWLLAECLYLRPNFLASFNEFVGGPSQGYRHLVDSSLDWGQDLPGLARFLNTNNAAHVPTYLAYFGTAEPDAYGIHAAALPSFLTREAETASEAKPLLPGIYCLSVTMLQDIYGLGPDYSPAIEDKYQRMRRALAQRDRLLADPAITGEARQLALDLPHNFRQLEFARLTAALRRQSPFAQIGYSINIYLVPPKTLAAALNGPPPY